MLAPVSHGCIPRSLLRTIALLDGTEEASFVGTDTHDSIAVWSITSDFCDRTSSVNEPWTHCDMLPGGLRVLGPVDATTSWNSMTLDNITDDGDDDPTAFLSSIDYTMLRCSFTTSLSWVPPFSHIADPSYRILQITPPPSTLPSPPPSHDDLFVTALETFRQTMQDPSRSFFQLPTLSSSCQFILAISGDVVHGKLLSNDTSNGRLSLRDVLPAYHERTHGGGAPYRSSHHPVTIHRAMSSSAAGAPLPVPSHRDIQDSLVRMGDKPPQFAGSKAWIGKATEHFTRFQHVVMNHITEAVNAVRQRERSSNASSNVSSKRVLLAGDERNRRAAYWAMKKVEARRLAEEQPIRRSRLEAVNKEPEWKKSLTSTRSGKSTVSKQISAND
ncbi:hypothetical protein B5M09_010228 [Aphanomyces astaci]|uniref:UFSP1/2/DUB catalytic domain-containing protein n=1 Tax=Aphanomyces astaci TaxID=112090 RepID=A0A425DMN7_APHAT|nr:hypothetical protein B5M09_010228 [Aphanomyces astaci]